MGHLLCTPVSGPSICDSDADVLARKQATVQSHRRSDSEEHSHGRAAQRSHEIGRFFEFV